MCGVKRLSLVCSLSFQPLNRVFHRANVGNSNSAFSLVVSALMACHTWKPSSKIAFRAIGGMPHAPWVLGVHMGEWHTLDWVPGPLQEVARLSLQWTSHFQSEVRDVITLTRGQSLLCLLLTEVQDFVNTLKEALCNQL